MPDFITHAFTTPILNLTLVDIGIAYFVIAGIFIASAVVVGVIKATLK